MHGVWLSLLMILATAAAPAIDLTSRFSAGLPDASPSLVGIPAPDWLVFYDLPTDPRSATGVPPVRIALAHNRFWSTVWLEVREPLSEPRRVVLRWEDPRNVPPGPVNVWEWRSEWAAREDAAAALDPWSFTFPYGAPPGTALGPTWMVGRTVRPYRPLAPTGGVVLWLEGWDTRLPLPAQNAESWAFQPEIAGRFGRAFARRTGTFSRNERDFTPGRIVRLSVFIQAEPVRQVVPAMDIYLSPEPTLGSVRRHR